MIQLAVKEWTKQKKYKGVALSFRLNTAYWNYLSIYYSLHKKILKVRKVVKSKITKKCTKRFINTNRYMLIELLSRTYWNDSDKIKIPIKKNNDNLWPRNCQSILQNKNIKSIRDTLFK